MAIVYRHRRMDKNEIFYVGIGKSEKRAYNVSNNRSSFWKSIVNKSEYSVEIIAKNLSWEEACELEILLIKEYGRKDRRKGSLVNLTDGGDGAKGYKRTIAREFSEETRIKMSEAQKRNGISESQRLNINYGFKNMSEESRYNMKKNQFKTKRIVNTKTGEFFESAKELSEFTGISYDKIKNQLNGRTINKLEYKYS